MNSLAKAPVAQLDRALASGARGRRFESCRAYHSAAAPTSSSEAFGCAFLRRRVRPSLSQTPAPSPDVLVGPPEGRLIVLANRRDGNLETSKIQSARPRMRGCSARLCQGRGSRDDEPRAATARGAGRARAQLRIELAWKQDLDRKRVLGKPAPRLASRGRRSHRPRSSRPHPAPANPPSELIQWRVRTPSHRSVGLTQGRGREGCEDVGGLCFRCSRRLGGVSARTDPSGHLSGRRVAWRRTAVLRRDHWRVGVARFSRAFDAERQRSRLGLRSQAVCPARIRRLTNRGHRDHRSIDVARQRCAGCPSARPSRARNQRSGMGLPRLDRRGD